MGAVLDALDEVVARFGRAVAEDPVALGAALRASTEPLADAEVEALTRAAAAGAVPRMRAALDRDAGPAEALAEGVAAVDADVDPGTASQERWACTALGAALGLVPRAVLDDAGRPGSEALPPRPGRRRRVAAAAVAAVLVLGVAVAVAVGGGGSGAPSPSAGPTAAPTPTPVPPTAAPSTTPAPTPQEAFVDPGLLAVAAPYVARPGASCTRDPAPQVAVREAVLCDLGDGWVGIFETTFTPELALDLRRGFLAAAALAVPDSVRSLRWKPVDGRPGVKTGIPAGSPERGTGLRIRFLDDQGRKWLYFDHDGTGHVGVLQTDDPARDLDDLRAFWADPMAPPG